MTTKVSNAYIQDGVIANIRIRPNVLTVIATDSNWDVIGSVDPEAQEATNVFLTSGTVYTLPGSVQFTVWAIGAGGGGGGCGPSDGTAAGGGGAGGVAVKTWTGSGNVSYVVGAAGAGGAGASAGSKGGNTIVTFGGLTIVAEGGGGGTTNSTNNSVGGTATNGDTNVEGGIGGGAAGDDGGGGGGGIGNADNPYVGSSNSGQNGAQSNDVAGLRAAIEALGESWTAPGAGSTSSGGNTSHGGDATGFGCGGGGGSWYGGRGGAGRYGGGGGGAGGYTTTHNGGAGGAGAVVLQYSASPNQLQSNTTGYIEIFGDNFTPTDKVMVGLEYIATSVTLANSRILRAELPSNIPAGTRDVYVVKENGNYAVKVQGVKHA